MSSEFDENGSGASGELVYITKTIVREDGHIYKETTLDGLMHAGPLGEPSAATYDPDGYPIMHSWHFEGKEHRDGAASTIAFHPGTKMPMSLSFKTHGKARRPEDGPFIVRLDKSGTVVANEMRDGSPWIDPAAPRHLEP